MVREREREQLCFRSTHLNDTTTTLRAGPTHLAALFGDRNPVIGFVTMEILDELLGIAAKNSSIARPSRGPGPPRG